MPSFKYIAPFDFYKIICVFLRCKKFPWGKCREMKLQKGALIEDWLAKTTEQHSLLHRGKKPKDRIGKQRKTDRKDTSIGNEEESLWG